MWLQQTVKVLAGDSSEVNNLAVRSQNLLEEWTTSCQQEFVASDFSSIIADQGDVRPSLSEEEISEDRNWAGAERLPGGVVIFTAEHLKFVISHGISWILPKRNYHQQIHILVLQNKFEISGYEMK